MISRYNLRLIVKRAKVDPVALLFYSIGYLKKERMFEYPMYDYVFPQNLVAKKLRKTTRKMKDNHRLFYLQNKLCKYKE